MKLVGKRIWTVVWDDAPPALFTSKYKALQYIKSEMHGKYRIDWDKESILCGYAFGSIRYYWEDDYGKQHEEYVGTVQPIIVK